MLLALFEDILVVKTFIGSMSVSRRCTIIRAIHLETVVVKLKLEKKLY